MTDRNEKLGIIVEATDHASGKLANVKREIAGMGAAARTSGMGGFFAGIERGAGRMKSAIGGAVSHAKRQLGSLASFGLATLGVGGILGVGAIISSSIKSASEFGASVASVSRITGLAAGTASALVDTLDKWGLSGDKLGTVLGRLQKNVFGLTDGSKAAKKFYDEFGVSLVNSKGKALDANAILLKSADYFNSNATASQKAAFLQKLYGKTWTDLIPILSKGSAAIKAEEKNSIKLTQQQLDNITKYRTASRDFQDVLGDVKVKIGAEIMPLITSGLVAASAWLDTHGDEVAGFFRDAGKFAGDALGTIAGVFTTIKSGWDSIPEPLRNMIVTGLVADRTVKFLFGFSPVQLLAGVGKDLLGGVVGGLGNALVKAGIGKAFVQPVFVTNAGFGGVGGPGGGGGGAGGLGLLGGIFALTAVAGIELAIADAVAPAYRKLLTGSDKPFAENPYYQDPRNQNVYQRERGGNPNWKPGDPTGPGHAAVAQITNSGMSPDERQAHRDQLARLNSIDDRTGAVKDHTAQAATAMDKLESRRLARAINVTVKQATSVKVGVSVRSVSGALKTTNTFASATNTNRTGGAVDAGDLW